MVRGDRAIFLTLLIFIILINSFVVFAAEDNASVAGTASTSADAVVPLGYDQAKSYEWLYNKVKNATFGVDQRAISTIALLQNPPGNAEGFVEALRDSEDRVNFCWPNGGCKVKDTALATLALILAGQNTAKEVAWLKNAKIPGLGSGDWWIVIKAGSSNNGSCQFSYKGANKTFDLQDDKVKLPRGGFTPGQYYVGLNDLSPNLKTLVQPSISVSCDTILNPIVTLIYKPNVNTFFIQRSDPGSNLQFKVANACFGTQVPSGSCNYDSTAYATWALLEIGAINNDPELSLENIGTHIYLESQTINKKNDPIALGLLNRILIKAGSAGPSFVSDLVKLQKAVDGSWGDITSTAIASFGLTGSDKSDSVARGISYLIDKVGKDGSWGGSVESTSWALIALHGGGLSVRLLGSGDVPVSNVEVCGNGLDDDADGADDCAEAECLDNAVCQCVNNIKDGDEDSIDCGGSCPVACEEQLPEEGKVEEGKKEEPVEVATEPTEEKKSLWWLWVLIILFLVGGVLFFYVKYIKTGKIVLSNIFKKKPKGPTFEDFRRQSEFRPVQTAQPQRTQSKSPVRPAQPGKPFTTMKPKSKEDEELERSMREAEKLLKG
ncbi:hypothetical protein J4230_02805 [Candidatus Woesearchaeota archaeon]|nr:hypothetical protein [Candidatus Woesearchaeota archaeon]